MNMERSKYNDVRRLRAAAQLQAVEKQNGAAGTFLLS
jgi:hypothetical protein